MDFGVQKLGPPSRQPTRVSAIAPEAVSLRHPHIPVGRWSLSLHESVSPAMGHLQCRDRFLSNIATPAEQPIKPALICDANHLFGSFDWTVTLMSVLI